MHFGGGSALLWSERGDMKWNFFLLRVRKVMRFEGKYRVGKLGWRKGFGRIW